MKNKEQILNGYQATFALSKTSKSQIYMAMDEYAKIKLKEAFINGFEQGFERGQSGLGIFNLAEDKANEYYYTQAGRV